MGSSNFWMRSRFSGFVRSISRAFERWTFEMRRPACVRVFRAVVASSYWRAK